MSYTGLTGPRPTLLANAVHSPGWLSFIEEVGTRMDLPESIAVPFPPEHPMAYWPTEKRTGRRVIRTITPSHGLDGGFRG